MISVQENVSLKQYNTFGLSADAAYFAEITDSAQLSELAQTQYWKLPRLILGGGSNILLLENFEGLVIYMNNKGIEILEENHDHVIVKVEAGENWHQFVLTAIEHGWCGIENLSLIPGSVGASPMQNIGAYGVEIEQVFQSLTAFDIHEKQFKVFNHEDCEFGYRTSVFKTREKGNYIISDVTYKLRKNPEINISYGAISSVLTEKNIQNPTIKDVSETVIAIRQSKLPDPDKIGNSGSFFKNPVVHLNKFEGILKDFPQMPFYEISSEKVKIPAGWLIEQCGWKGKKVGNAGTYKHQALIIVNHGDATGKEIWALAKEIRNSVIQKFGIELEPEVNLIFNE